MTSGVSVIVDAGQGGRALLRTVDSIARQRFPHVDLTLLRATACQTPAIVDSIRSRLSAVVVEAGERLGVALNQGVRNSRGQYLAFVPCGFELEPAFLDRCASTLERAADASALAPSVLLHTADRRGGALWVAEGTVAAAVLADPHSVPPVFVVRRTAWEALGGFDERLNGLVEYEFWLRLVLDGRRIERIDGPLVARELAAGEAPDRTGGDRLALFRAVLERHHAVIAGAMDEVLVAGEVRFGRAREAHRQLLVRRDADLAELDRLRAEAAHHRAYLEYHGRQDVDWGDLRRVDPVSRDWGYDRGLPVDRRYIEDFLAAHSSDVQGVVLEVQEDDFTRAYGGSRVTEGVVLDIDAANPRADVLADLRRAPEIPSERFDCVILTQTLHVIDDPSAALRECHRILKPGGVLLATLPSASRVCLEYGASGDLWRVTPAGARALFHAAFTPADSTFDVFGNVLTNAAFLHGFATHELKAAEFDTVDPYYPALTGVRARKTALPTRAAPRGVVLLYHRIDDTADVHELGVPPSVFDAHLEWLRSACTPMALDEMLSARPDALPERPVAVTFDDGYLDNLEAALPLLHRHRVPATFFVTSRWLDEPGEYWWDLLERVLLGGAELPPVLRMEVGGRSHELATTTVDERVASHWRLHDILVHASLDERERAVERLLDVSRGSAPRVRPMAADEVRQLAALPGVTVGGHTVNHLSLPDQPSAVCRDEIAACADRLTRVVGRPVSLFAYPYGTLDPHVAAVARRDCRWAMSCDARVLGDSFDAARVPRLEAKRWPVDVLAATVNRLFQPAPPAIPRALTRFP